MEVEIIYALYSTHGLYSDGGKKVHIAINSANPLCGRKDIFGVTDVDKNWVRQPDPEMNMCQKCKKAALRKINHNKQPQQ